MLIITQLTRRVSYYRCREDLGSAYLCEIHSLSWTSCSKLMVLSTCHSDRLFVYSTCSLHDIKMKGRLHVIINWEEHGSGCGPFSIIIP